MQYLKESKVFVKVDLTRNDWISIRSCESSQPHLIVEIVLHSVLEQQQHAKHYKQQHHKANHTGSSWTEYHSKEVLEEYVVMPREENNF